MAGKRNQRTNAIGSPTSGNISDSSSKEQDRFLPIANVSRIMKKSLPANAKISKEAKETVQECVSEFISFITGEASEKCQREKRKTINGNDLIWAMTTLGFENYVGPLKIYLSKYKETEGEKNSMARQEDHHSPTDHNSNTKEDQMDFQQGFFDNNNNNNGGFYSLGAQVNNYNHPKIYRENSSRFVDYGENLMGYGENSSGNFNRNRIRENGGGNSNNTAMTAQLHHGVQW